MVSKSTAHGHPGYRLGAGNVDEAPKISATTKLEVVERELKYRRHVYPRLVAEHKMTQHLADTQLEAMEAIAEDYRALAAKERLL